MLQDTRIAVIDWLRQNPGFHSIDEIVKATGYARSTVMKTCEHWVQERGAVRRGEPHTAGEYAAAERYGAGVRML